MRSHEKSTYKLEALKFIEGDFMADDATEILRDLFSYKINFYKIKNLSSQVRSGRADQLAQQRISSLRNEMEKFGSILSDAKMQNKSVVIDAQISIQMIDENPVSAE